jgi:hypothetical protein
MPASVIAHIIGAVYFIKEVCKVIPTLFEIVRHRSVDGYQAVR